MEGPCAESEEKHEPASDADAAVVDSLKALDLNRPIREADIALKAVGKTKPPPTFCTNFPVDCGAVKGKFYRAPEVSSSRRELKSPRYEPSCRPE
jgi:hypothetical protein